jgi:hypothetical protein
MQYMVMPERIVCPAYPVQDKLQKTDGTDLQDISPLTTGMGIVPEGEWRCGNFRL